MWQEVNQSLPIKFNFTGGEVNKFIEALKGISQNTLCNSHPVSGILSISDANLKDLNLFRNYGQLNASKITTHAKFYFDAGTSQTQNNDQLYHFLKNSLTSSGTAKIIAKSTKYHI